MKARKLFRYFESDLTDTAIFAFSKISGIPGGSISHIARGKLISDRQMQTRDGSMVSAAVRQMGAYSFCFVLTIGVPSKGDGDYETLLMDLWANAYLHAAKKRLLQIDLPRITEVSPENKEVLKFNKLITPGIAGVSLSENVRIVEFTGAKDIGVSVFDTGAMNPVKTLAAVAVYSTSATEIPKELFCKNCNSLQDFSVNPEGCIFCFEDADSFDGLD